MSYFASNTLYPSIAPIPNGFAAQMNEKPNKKNIFLNGSPMRTSYLKPSSTNVISPMKNNFISHPVTKEVVYENIKPVFILLRIMGILPLTQSSGTLHQFSFMSAAMLYSVILFSSLVGYVIYLSLYKVQILRSTDGKFEETVIEYLFTVYLFPMTAIPIMWCEAHKIAGVLNSWIDFEIAYKQLTSRTITIELYRKALTLSIVIPVLSTTSVIITHLTMVHFQFMQIIPYVFLEILTYMLGTYWYLVCETLSICANVLAEDFQMALRNIGPAGKVASYRALWLRLSKIARDTGIANCYTFTFINLYLFLIITLSIYGLLSQISDGFGTKDIGLAMTAICSIFLLFFICDEAHYASHNVRTNFQKKLLMVELTWMNADAQTEVNMFLRATEMNPSQISLGGFFNVNRNLFKSLLATMVTYLVVLLQFQISIPEESRGQSNETFFNTTEPVTRTTTTYTTLSSMLTTIVKKKKKH